MFVCAISDIDFLHSRVNTCKAQNKPLLLTETLTKTKSLHLTERKPNKCSMHMYITSIVVNICSGFSKMSLARKRILFVYSFM